MELIVELVLQVIGEVVFQGGFELGGWVLRRRWGRVLFGIVLGVAGGLAWGLLVSDAAPLVGSLVLVAQVLAIPIAGDRWWFRWKVTRVGLIDAAAVGAAVVGTRWLVWAVA